MRSNGLAVARRLTSNNAAGGRELLTPLAEILFVVVFAGGFSPCVRANIGGAYLPRELKDGDFHEVNQPRLPIHMEIRPRERVLPGSADRSFQKPLTSRESDSTRRGDRKLPSGEIMARLGLFANGVRTAPRARFGTMEARRPGCCLDRLPRRETGTFEFASKTLKNYARKRIGMQKMVQLPRHPVGRGRRGTKTEPMI